MFLDSEHWQVGRDGYIKRIPCYADVRDLRQAALLPAIIQLRGQVFAHRAFSSFICSTGKCGGSPQEALHQWISPLDA
jgi:hypothetical protein